MPEEFQKKGGRNRIIYISVVVVILLVIISLFALKQSKKEDELSGAVTAALQDSEAAGEQEGGSAAGAAGGTGETGNAGSSVSKSDTTGAKATTTTLKSVTLAAPSDIIKAIVELRQQSNANEFVKVAGLVTYLNDQFTAGNIDAVAVSWRGDVVNCVYDKCSDSKYAKLIDDYVLQNTANSKFKLTHHVVELYTLWNGRNLIEFSETVTKVNGMVVSINDAKITEKWKAVVACKGTCSEFPDKIFDMILAVNAA